MKAENLRTEYLSDPLGIGIVTPRLSWTCDEGTTQTAYRIIALRSGQTVWDSGTVQSSRMTHVQYQGQPLKSRDRVEWRVTLWDETGHDGVWVSSQFEIGLLDDSDWAAQWITGDYTPQKGKRHPVDHFRRRFNIGSEILRARLYATAHGVYQTRINGKRIGDFELAPGTTDYRKRLQYQTYDVTGMLGADNELEFELADGWYRGSLGAFGPISVFGRQTALRSQLEIELVDGTILRINSDSGFEWSNDGPIRFADLQDGEAVDLRKTPSYQGTARIAKLKDAPVPTASDNIQPKKHETFVPTLLTTPSGARVLDFGQNIAGFIGFTVVAKDGQQIKLWMGETLDAAGEFTQANFQKQKPAGQFGRPTELLLMTGQEKLIRRKLQPTPAQQTTVVCRDGENAYQTRYAIFGFRYALVETDVEISPANFSAVAVYSDMEETGEFECSNLEVNALLANTRWSMKGNFLDVPTDCPTRERLAWTGDAQIFFDTASYLMDVTSFYRKWLRDLQDNQFPSGKVSAVAPYNGIAVLYETTGGSVGWGDATVLVPYRFWKKYGDTDLLREFYPMMRAYGRFMIDHAGEKRRSGRRNPDAKYVYEKGFHLGEWLEPEEFKDAVTGRGKPSRAEEATAYLHYTMTHLAEIAHELGETGDAALFGEYADGSKRAYNFLFLSSGTIDTDRQAKLVRPLAFGLADGTTRQALQERLISAVEHRDYRIGTGFLSTPFVLPSLTEAGRPDVAYRMLENTQAPSWLAEVRDGATTVWEDWEGKESQNHYSPGAVCQWLFDTVAGIRVDGSNHFSIAPVPGGTLTSATARYQSIYGSVASSWKLRDGQLQMAVEVPPNTTADVSLPNGERHFVHSGRHTYEIPHKSPR